jgi:hypothetical protein
MSGEGKSPTTIGLAGAAAVCASAGRARSSEVAAAANVLTNSLREGIMDRALPVARHSPRGELPSVEGPCNGRFSTHFLNQVLAARGSLRLTHSRNGRVSIQRNRDGSDVAELLDLQSVRLPADEGEHGIFADWRGRVKKDVHLSRKR